jgi:hypothetical protein
MKKDIVIPEVKNAQVLAIREWSDDFGSDVWYVYLLNTYETNMEMALVVSQAQGVIKDEERLTSALRHSYKEIAPFTAVRLEMLTTDVLELNNTFKVSFFIGNQMFNKDFTFPANSILEDNQVEIATLHTQGVLAR